MSRRIDRLATFLAKHALACFLVGVFITAVLGGAAWTYLRVEMDAAALLPEDSEVAQTTAQALRDFGSFDYMLCSISNVGKAKEADLIDAAEKMATALTDPRFVRSVTYKLDPNRLDLAGSQGESRILALLTEQDWNSLEKKLEPENVKASVIRLKTLLRTPLPPDARKALLKDPLGFADVLEARLTVLRGPLQLNLSKGYFISSDGEMALLLLWPVERSSDLVFARDFGEFLDGTRSGMMVRNPEWKQKFVIDFVGTHIEAVENTRQVREDLARTSIASFLAILVLFLFAYRRPEALLFVALPLAAGMVWTLGLTALTIGSLNQVTMIFAAIIIGNGVDFSIHVYNRFIEEVRVGTGHEQAVHIALARTGGGIVAGGLSAAIAFVSMMSTSFRGFQQLGFVAALGTVSSIATVFLMLPWLMIKVIGKFHRRADAMPLSTMGLKRAYSMTSNYPRLTLLTTLAVCAFLGWNARNVSFDQDFRALQQPPIEYERVWDQVRSHFKTPSNQVILIVEEATREAALDANDRLYANIPGSMVGREILAVDSLRSFLPSARSQKEALERMARQPLAKIRAELAEAGRAEGVAPAAFAPFLCQMERLQAVANEALKSRRTPVTFADYAEGPFRSLMQRYIHRSPNGYRIITQIYPAKGVWETEVSPAFLEAIRAGIPHVPRVTGVAIVEQELRGVVVKDLARAVLFVLATLFVYLVLHFRSLWMGLLALIPVLLASLCMLGSLDLMGISLNYVNIIILPIVLGVGVDSSVHLVHRYKERGRRDIQLSIERTGRAVLVTGMTTMVGFGALIFASFRGIREMGVVSLVGLGLTLIASLVVLPAILALTDPKVFFGGGPGDELG